MSFIVQHEKLVINNASSNFNDSIAHIPSDHGQAQYGQIFMTSEVIGDPECTTELISLIMDELITEYYDDLEKDTFESFESALHTVNAALSKYAQSEPDWVGKLNMSVGIYTDNTLHITTAGRGEVYLLRQGQVIDIAEDLSSSDINNPNKTFFNISSGKLTTGDKIIFANNKIKHAAPHETYIQAAENNSATQVVEDLSQKLQVKPGESISLTILEVTDKIAKAGAQPKQTPPPIIQEINNFEETEVDEEEEEEEEETTKQKESFDIKSFIQKIVTTKPDKEWIKKVREKAIEVKSQAKEKKFKLPASEKTTSLIIVGIIAVLVLIIAFNFIQSESSVQSAQLRSTYTEVNARIDDADLKSLYDKPAAIDILVRQQALLRELEDQKFDSEKIAMSNQAINSIMDKIFNTTRFIDAQADAQLNTRPKGIVALEEKVFAYDSKNLYPIAGNVVDVREIIPPEENDQIITATSLNNDIAILFITEAGKLLRFKEGAVTEIPSADNGWPTSTAAMTEYIDTTKFYILDPAANEIWYHALTGNRASRAQSRNKLEIDLSNAVSFAVDGNIYVLKSDGEIIKTYGSDREEFLKTTWPENITSTPKEIFTTANHNRMYVFFPEENTVMYTAKDGRYIGQYRLEKNDEQIRKFYPDEENKVLFLLTTNNSIYRIKTP